MITRSDPSSSPSPIFLLLLLFKDFKLVKDWSPACTHLFMREIRVNLKVLFALVTLAPIVGWKWIDALKLMEIDHFSLPLVNVTSSEDEESVQGGEAVPLSSYLPRVDVSDLTLATALDNGQVSFLCNPNRRAIFANRHFVFFTEKQVRLGKRGKGRDGLWV